MVEPIFYIVWNARIWSSATYATLALAKDAQRILQKSNPDITFVILRSIRDEFT